MFIRIFGFRLEGHATNAEKAFAARIFARFKG